jgi:hypothetical protein
MEAAWISVSLLTGWIMWSLRHTFEYSRESFWICLAFGMLEDLESLGTFVKDISWAFMNVIVLIAFPLIILTDWLYTKWVARA